MPVLMWLWSLIKSVLNAFARIVVVAIVVIAILATIRLSAGDGLPNNMVLSLDLRTSMEDKSAPSLLELTASKLSIMDTVFGLDAASRDPRVKGVYLRLGTGDLSVAQAQELRDALRRFKAADKFVISHAQSFYSGGLGDYELAAISDQIWMQPVGAFFAAGASGGTLFLKGLFDKIQAVPQFVQRYEYKNAADTFMQTDYTPAHREATTRVLQSWYDSALVTIAADRQMTREALVATLEESPSSAEFVRERGLITAIGYDDEAENAARGRAGAGARITEFTQYLNKAPTRPRNNGPVFALVHAAGEIVEGEDKETLTGGVTGVAGDTFAQAVRAATRDRDVRAIVVRVDSPGGSAIASDQILDALKKARAAGKPVVVSMGSVAASGGYYISLAADKIIAEPGTLTGSIGVVWGKFAIGKTLESLAGVRGGEIGIGKNALFLSGMQPWTEDQMAEVNAQADLVYEDFTRKVAEGRKLPLERVQEIARGRVWTGADARERGLVDELGGFWTAVDSAKVIAEIDPETRVRFRDYPRRENLFQRVADIFESSAAAMATLQSLNTLVSSDVVQSLLSGIRAGEGGAQLRALDLPQH